MYFFVSIAALNILDPGELEQSKAPLVRVVTEVGLPAWPIAALSLAIILNGALTQIIMATRVIYSMGKRSGVPGFLGKVSSLTNTPLVATVASTCVCIALALYFPLKTLAGITNFIMLLVFVASNIALIILEKRKPEVPFDTPRFLPWVALALSLSLLVASFFVGSGGH